MKSCFQFQKQNILEHGKSVHHYYKELLLTLINHDDKYKLPENLYQKKEFLVAQYPLHIMKHYHILHDCGKPQCETIDEHGKKHFYGHENISYETYISLYDGKLNPHQQIIANLIKNDMYFHKESMEDIRNFISEKNKSFLYSLLLTSFAELYANATMFGPEGVNSTSFKIKYKKLDKVSKIIFK